MLFNYEARTISGEPRVGQVEAFSQDAAIEILQRNELILLNIRESSEISIFSKKMKFLERVSKKEVVIFSRQMSALLQAKVPIIESLKTMIVQIKNEAFRNAIEKITQSVDAGNPLSKSLAEHKKVFSTFYISVVHAGELSGKLEDVFTYLADTLEREFYLTQKVRGAMMYPAFIMLGLVGVLFVMMVWVIPNLTTVFTEAGVDLPLLTRIIIAMSNIFQDFWWLILMVLAGAGFGLWYWVGTPIGKAIWGKAQLKIPIFGDLLIKFYIARFADSLGTLIKGGLPIIQSLEVSADIAGNDTYKKIISETIEAVRKGNTISSVFKTREEVPIMVSQMIYIGEQSGKLDQTLKTVANFYQKEVANAMDNLVTIIEPVLILVLGVMVGILLVGILMPMYNLTSAI